MPIDLETFQKAYDRWVKESLADYQAGKMEEIVKKYPFIVPDDVPWTPYKGEASAQTFALVTSGGLYLKDSQPPFDTESIHGDTSFREIPKSASQDDFGIAHAHYDHSLAEQDINIIFPLQRFIELEKEKIIGRFADTHYSFSYVNDAATLVKKTVPDLISRISSKSMRCLNGSSNQGSHSGR
ncbi:MAG: glycine/betaine/sarcosine/D-proline family reductase selenoprotein B [Desulfobacterales bacterium]|nr:glycine/betaine/sarcosine/D-proline family reductase selenoprotein B [Desulfobacterales bacterium]